MEKDASNNRSRDLTKKTLYITIGRVSTQFISFLLLPLYTALLTTEEYGIVDLIITLVQLLIPIISVMIDQGVFRYLLNCHTEDKKRETITSAFFLLFVTGGVTIAIYSIVGIFFDFQYKIWLLLILIATAFSNLFLQIARGLKHTGDYALGSFVCSSSTIVLNVLCIAYLKMGATGMLVATFAGNVICCLFLFFKLRIGQYIQMSAFKIKVARNELKYSLPLVPNQLSLWVMNSSDRLIVTFFLGTAANGILAVSHKFPTVFSTMFSIFVIAWHESGAIHYYDDDRDNFFSEIVNKVVMIFATICTGFIVVIPIVFNWFVNKAYSEAYYYIPIYLVAFLFNVIIGMLGVVYVATKKTTEIAKTTIIAAILNITINILLIRYIGLYAAAVSTLVSFLVTMIYRVVDTKKYLKINYDVKQIIGISASIGVSIVIYYINNRLLSLTFLIIFIIGAYLFNRETVDSALSLFEEKTRINTRKIIASTIVLCSLLFLIVGFFMYKNDVQPKEVQTVYEGEVKSIEPIKIVSFDSFEEVDFTCTGLTYDSNDDAFWIGDYGAMNQGAKVHPRIVEVDKDFNNTIQVINLENKVGISANLQGVAFDSVDNSIWLAIGDSVVEINKEGDMLTTLDLGKYAKYKANGICYSEKDDTLWILCESQYLIHLSKDGTVISEYSFNFANQDHISIMGNYLYITVGADYQGENNYICRVSSQNGNIDEVYRTQGANALEGICFFDGMVMIANDGLYHNDIVGHSYISVYSSDEITR